MGHRKAIPTEFPEVLALLRGIYKWSKSEAARRSGISPSLYGRYEAGAVEPSMSNILKIRAAFRVDFETLIGEKNINIIPSENDRDKLA